MLSSFVNYFLGYVKFSIKGSFCERFLNLCGLHNRDIWNIKKHNDVMICYTKASEYKNLRKEARKCGTKLRIIKKYGLPFVIHKNRHRYGVPMGIILGILLISILSGYVWNIDVSGNNYFSNDAIIGSLNEYGVHVGMRKKLIDPSNTKEKIMSKYDGVSWMSINPVGTTLQVDISERVVPPDVHNNTEPCHIVAKCDGVIKSIKVTEGRAVVKVGDAVVKGDLLVSGILEHSNGAIVMKRARGEIVAQTERFYSSKVRLQQENIVLTGKTKERKVLHFFNINIPLYIGELNDNWIKKVIYKPVVINGVELPYGVSHGVFSETVKKQNNITLENAVKIGKNDIKRQIEKQGYEQDVKLVNETVENVNNIIEIRQKYVFQENIGIEEKVLIF